MTFVELNGEIVNVESIDRIGIVIGRNFFVFLRNGHAVQLCDANPERVEILRNRLVQHLTHRRIESF